MLHIVLLVAFFLPSNAQEIKYPYEGTSCPPLRVSSGVKVIPPTCTQQKMLPGTVCSFSCKEKYRVHGPPIKQCMDTGSWTDNNVNTSCTDMNECRIRNGGCSHKCINTDGGYRCECPPNLKLDKDGRRCRAEGLRLRCGVHDMKIVIPKAIIHNLHHEHLRLNDPSCGAQGNATHYSLSTSLTGCGTTSRQIKDYIVYSNKVSEQPDKDSNTISRIQPGEVQIPFCCYYHNREIVHAVGFGPRNRELYIRVKGRGKLKLKLDFYKTKNYGSFYTWDDYPVSVLLRQRLYFEVSLETKEKDLVVFADNCCSTPTRDHEKSRYLRHTFLHNGCPVDKTVRSHQSPSKNKERFSLEAFKFLGDHPFVFVHCHVIVCDAKDLHSRCAQGCIPGNHGNRHAPGGQKGRVKSILAKAKTKVKAKAMKTENGRHKRDASAVTLGKMQAVTLSLGPFLLDEKAEMKEKRTEITHPVENKGETKLREDEEQTEEKNKQQGLGFIGSILLVTMTVASVMALLGVLYLGHKSKNVAPFGYDQLNTKSNRL